MARSMTIDYADDILLALGLSPEEFCEEAKLLIAVKLCEMGRLSTGAAAELADLPKPLFLTKLADYGVDTSTCRKKSFEAIWQVRDVICNTSPLQYLHQAELLHLFPELFGSVQVPSAVNAEIEEGRRRGVNLPDLATLPWVTMRSVRDRTLLPLVTSLGPRREGGTWLGVGDAGSFARFGRPGCAPIRCRCRAGGYGNLGNIVVGEGTWSSGLGSFRLGSPTKAAVSAFGNDLLVGS